jgi:predicted Zn-dependent protease
VANRHSADQLSKGLAANLGLGVLAALLGEGTGAKVAQIGASVAANATMAKFSRDDEREADEKGLVYLKRAGYDPRAAAAFMRILRTTSGRDPGAVEVFFASHPAPAERVTRLEAEAARVGGGGRTTSAAFTAMHARLERLGPAKAMPKQPR